MKDIKLLLIFRKVLIKIISSKLFYWINDKTYIKIMFYLNMKSKLNLKEPISFNEKLQWLKLYNRKKIYTTLVDKYNVKKFVSNSIGEEYIIPTIGIYNNLFEIDFKKLPKSFVIKCTHDSGGLVICNDKTYLNLKSLKQKISKSLKNNYYYYGREWPYKNVEPKILVEKYMGNNLNDYKIFCFNGEPKFTLVCSNRINNKKNTDFYDNEWNLLPFTRKKHNNNPKGIEKPRKFNEMLNIAKKLSKNIPFVRVDLYEIDGKVYFGELTFYPSGGFEGFNPEYWDEKIGELIDLKNIPNGK